jgi:hypothetical protein
MTCRRCETGHLVVEDLTVAVWRCVNCGDRQEPGHERNPYQRAVVAALAELAVRAVEDPAILRAEAILRAVG